MSSFENTRPISQGLFGSLELDSAHSSAIKKTRMLLSMSVLSALIRGSIVSNSLAMIQFSGSGIGWTVAMMLLNGIPYVVMA